MRWLQCLRDPEEGPKPTMRGRHRPDRVLRCEPLEQRCLLSAGGPDAISPPSSPALSIGPPALFPDAQQGQAEFSDLVTGVTQITSGGAPGPLAALSDAWKPIVAGDDDTSFPSTLVLAREYGEGRVVVFGHDGLTTNVDALDNGTFLENTISWLDVSDGAKVLYTTGHGEWVNGGNLGGLAQRLAGGGTTMTALSGTITSEKLAAGSVLIVGNAWADFTSAEIEAVRTYTEAGGGLLMAGLGWSWEPYHAGTTIEDYPMMKMAAPYDVRWLKGTISDPTDQYNGSAVFHTFYPDIASGTVADAKATILQIHADHPDDLPAALHSDATLWTEFLRAHQTLGVPAKEFPADHPQRMEIFEFSTELAGTFPDFYGKDHAFPIMLYPESAWLRERFWRTWRDAVELTPALKTEMATAGGLFGSYAEIFDRWGIILLDNTQLDQPQLDYLTVLLEGIPDDLHHLRSISVKDFLGTAPAGLQHDGLSGQPGAVNIFGVRVGQYPENSFPDDVPPGIVSVFCGCAAHEVNHVVEAFTIRNTPELAARQTALIAAAGTDHLNYLRSMISDGFFVNAPQEFFASISNEWFTDSAKTVELGILRFENDRPDPINQALFFADVYSQGGVTTHFYTTDYEGSFTASAVPLSRDEHGHINGLQVGTTWYSFELDTEGNVLGYSTAPPPPPGDLNLDGAVNSQDLDIVRANWGRTVPAGSLAEGDPSGDGLVGSADLDVVRANWGGIAAASATCTESDGEPAHESTRRNHRHARHTWAEAVEALARDRERNTKTAAPRSAVDLVLEGWDD